MDQRATASRKAGHNSERLDTAICSILLKHSANTRQGRGFCLSLRQMSPRALKSERRRHKSRQ